MRPSHAHKGNCAFLHTALTVRQSNGGTVFCARSPKSPDIQAHRCSVSREGMEAVSLLQLPHAGGAIAGGGDQHAAVGGRRHVGERPCVAAQQEHAVPDLHVPHPGCAVRRHCSQGADASASPHCRPAEVIISVCRCTRASACHIAGGHPDCAWTGPLPLPSLPLNTCCESRCEPPV